MAKVREKQLQKRKHEALDAAMRLLMERGYANLNMDELAEEVGISKPTLYQYFNSKEELVAQAMIRTFQKLEARISDLSDKPPLEQLEQFLRSMLRARHENRSIMAQIDVEIMRSIVRHYPNTVEHLVTTKSKLIEVVSKAQEQGEVDPELPAWVVVNMMFSLQGIIKNPFMKDDPQRSDEEVAEAIEAIVRMFKRSISVGSPVETPVLR